VTALARNVDIAAGLPDAVVSVDSEQRIVFVNASAEQMFGYTADELLGSKLEVVLPAAEPESRAPAEFVARRKNGGTFPVEIAFVGANLTDCAQRTAVVRDISERKARERALMAARSEAAVAQRAKADFVDKLHHALSTPLAALLGFTEQIYDQDFGPVGDPRYVSAASAIRDCGEHLRALIDDVLTMNSLESGEYPLHEEVFAVDEAVDASCRMMSPVLEKAGIRLVRETPAGCRLRADPRAVRQMLLSLLSNAAKFTPAGGRATVRAELDDRGCLALSVTDTGIGIRDDELRRVTRAFDRRDPGEEPLPGHKKGTGLGLAITRALVEAHGGALEIDSAVARGTTVRLLFPAERVVASHGPGKGP